jgi:hypothetical protein
VNTVLHIEQPRDHGALATLIERLGAVPCPCTPGPARRSSRSAAPQVLLSSGGGCPVGDQAAFSVRLGRRPPRNGEPRCDLWCAASSEEAREISATGIAAEVHVTGHPDIERLSEAVRHQKSVPTVFVAAGGLEPARLERAIGALSEAPAVVDLVVHLDVEASPPALTTWLEWARRAQASNRRIVPLPPGATDLLPTLAQADLLIADCREWVEPFLVLDRPIVWWGDATAGERERYGAAVADADDATLAAVVAAGLERAGQAQRARRECVTRFAGPVDASRRIAAEVDLLIERAA